MAIGGGEVETKEAEEVDVVEVARAAEAVGEVVAGGLIAANITL